MSDTPNPADTDPNAPHLPSPLFLVAPDIDNHTLLEYACVFLASANVMASDFARSLNGVQGSVLLGIQQSIMLGKWR